MIAGPSPWYSASSATCGSIPALLICSYSEATCWNLQTCDVVQPGTSHGLHVPHLCQGFRIQVRWRRHAGEGELRQSRWWTNSRWELKSPKAAHSRRRRRQSGAGAAWEARCLRRSRHSCDETFCDDPTNKTQNHAAPLACLEGVGDLAGAADLLAALESRGLSDPQGLLGLGVPGRGGLDHQVVHPAASRESPGSLEVHLEAHLEALRPVVGLRATAPLALLQVAVENRALLDPELLSNDMPQTTLGHMHKARIRTTLFWLLPACWGLYHLLQPLLPWHSKRTYEEESQIHFGKATMLCRQ